MVESCEGKSQDQMKKKKKRIGGSKEIKLIWANNRRKCQSYEKYMCCNDNNNRCPDRLKSVPQRENFNCFSCRSYCSHLT